MLWDRESMRPLAAPLTGHTADVTSVAVSPNGALIASGDYDGTVLLWDVAARSHVGPALSGHGRERVNRVAFSPDGSLLATAGGDGRLLLWNVNGRQLVGPVLEGQQKGVAGTAFSPDRRTMASGSGDGAVQLWDVSSRRPLGDPVLAHGGQRADHFAFGRDGKTLVSLGGTYLNLWNLQDGRALGPRVALDPIDAERRQGLGGGVAISPDGSVIVSGGNNRLVLWDTASGQPLSNVLWGWRGTRTSLAMAPDGTAVAASHGDGIVLWDVALGSWQHRACRMANRELTVEEWNTFVGPELPYRRTCSELGTASK